MSTRSTISIKNEDGTFTGIYCHFDGYPSGVGATLLEHYTDAKKVNSLVSLGGISSLNEQVEPQGEHSYESPDEKTTVAYGRDRGEEGTEPQTSREWQDNESYNYLFEDGKWYVDGDLLTQDIIDED